MFNNQAATVIKLSQLFSLVLMIALYSAYQYPLLLKEVSPMKKKIIITMLATAILSVGATKVYAANPLDGYDITIYDQTTPAVFAA